MLQYNQFAQVHTVDQNLWAVDEIGKTIFYIYSGDRRVLLLDTGFGLTDLKKLVAELCPGKEIVVVNSHAHGDHNSGNAQFDTVCCGRMDEPFNHQPVSKEMKERFVQSFFLGNPRAEGVGTDTWKPGPSAKTIPLADGDKIDLGGITLEVLETPGHSIGSICLLDRANGYLFTGDMVLTWEVWGQLETSCALKYYAQSLRRMASLGVQRVFPAHGVPDNAFGCPVYELPPGTLEVYASGTEEIVQGKTKGEPYACFANDGLCKLFKVGGMVYDPNRIGNEIP